MSLSITPNQGIFFAALLCFVVAVYFIFVDGYWRTRKAVKNIRTRRAMANTTKYITVRKEAEIDETLNKCLDANTRNETDYPGYTYEDGVRFMLEWLTDLDAPNPFDEL